MWVMLSSGGEGEVGSEYVLGSDGRQVLRRLKGELHGPPSWSRRSARSAAKGLGAGQELRSR
jgi:hypothetical protein